MTASAATQTARPTHAITRPRIDSTVEILGVGDESYCRRQTVRGDVRDIYYRRGASIPAVGDVLDIYDGSVFASL